jgi:hypothetical protein
LESKDKPAALPEGIPKLGDPADSLKDPQKTGESSLSLFVHSSFLYALTSCLTFLSFYTVLLMENPNKRENKPEIKELTITEMQALSDLARGSAVRKLETSIFRHV